MCSKGHDNLSTMIDGTLDGKNGGALAGGKHDLLPDMGFGA